MDTRALRDALGCFATGITVITSVDSQGKPVGVTVNSFNSVSLDPPLILFSLAHDADTLPVVQAHGRFAVNVLSKAQEALSNRFATPELDRWGDQPFAMQGGVPVLPQTLATLVCAVEHVVPGGDHQIIIGRVESLRWDPVGEPLLYHRGQYRGLATTEHEARLEAFSQELYEAIQTCQNVAPLTERWPQITLKDAYHISLGILARRQAAGERLVGKKVGVTGHAIQKMLKVGQPDFGFLTDVMQTGAQMKISGVLSQARAEAELAFILKDRLMGPGVTPQDVLDATEAVAVCFEVVDSRVANWKIKIEDTVADNASSGLFVLGPQRAAPDAMDWSACKVEVTMNGQPLSSGTGADSSPGSPEACVAWLANTLGAYGMALEPGEVILSGALVPLQSVVAGDRMTATIDGLGSVSVEFV